MRARWIVIEKMRERERERCKGFSPGMRAGNIDNNEIEKQDASWLDNSPLTHCAAHPSQSSKSEWKYIKLHLC
jgi:hypothetical protein